MILCCKERGSGGGETFKIYNLSNDNKTFITLKTYQIQTLIYVCVWVRVCKRMSQSHSHWQMHIYVHTNKYRCEYAYAGVCVLVNVLMKHKNEFMASNWIFLYDKDRQTDTHIFSDIQSYSNPHTHICVCVLRAHIHALTYKRQFDINTNIGIEFSKDDTMTSRHTNTQNPFTCRIFPLQRNEFFCGNRKEKLEVFSAFILCPLSLFLSLSLVFHAKWCADNMSEGQQG